jgi:hypothetical protein
VIESVSKKSANGYFITIESVMHARLPPVRSPSPDFTQASEPFENNAQISSEHFHNESRTSQLPSTSLQKTCNDAHRFPQKENRKQNLHIGQYERAKDRRKPAGQLKSTRPGIYLGNYNCLEDDANEFLIIPKKDSKRAKQSAVPSQGSQVSSQQLSFDNKQTRQWNFNLSQTSRTSSQAKSYQQLVQNNFVLDQYMIKDSLSQTTSVPYIEYDDKLCNHDDYDAGQFQNQYMYSAESAPDFDGIEVHNLEHEKRMETYEEDPYQTYHACNQQQFQINYNDVPNLTKQVTTIMDKNK